MKVEIEIIYPHRVIDRSDRWLIAARPDRVRSMSRLAILRQVFAISLLMIGMILFLMCGIWYAVTLHPVRLEYGCTIVQQAPNGDCP